MDTIFTILEADTDMPEDGYFRNSRKKAYRCEAIREMFRGLQRESQDKALRLAMELLIAQNDPETGATPLVSNTMLICE